MAYGSSERTRLQGLWGFECLCRAFEELGFLVACNLTRSEANASDAGIVGRGRAAERSMALGPGPVLLRELRALGLGPLGFRVLETLRL